VGYDAIMRRFGICRDYAKGSCQSDAATCRFKHREPAELDLGNDRTTWEHVRAREEVASSSSFANTLVKIYIFFFLSQFL